MPAAAWIDERHLPALGLSNYWGYNPVAFLAPDPRLAPGGWAEIGAAVAALHAAGIAVLLDVVLNHTGEGDHLGPTVSLRGLDNAGCYRLLASDDPSKFINDTGCGNTLALDFRRRSCCALLPTRCVCWAMRAGIDGFRPRPRDNSGPPRRWIRPRRAAALGDRTGPGAAHPRLHRRAVGHRPRRLPAGARFPPRWGEWNDRYRDTVRRFWRGDGGLLGELATRFAGSADVFASRHRLADAQHKFRHRA